MIEVVMHLNMGLVKGGYFDQNAACGLPLFGSTHGVELGFSTPNTFFNYPDCPPGDYTHWCEDCLASEEMGIFLLSRIE